MLCSGDAISHFICPHDEAVSWVQYFLHDQKMLAFCMGTHSRLGEASPLKQLAPGIVKAIFDAWWTEDCTELVRLLQ